MWFDGDFKCFKIWFSLSIELYEMGKLIRFSSIVFDFIVLILKDKREGQLFENWYKVNKCSVANGSSNENSC